MSRTNSRSYPPFEGFDIIRRELIAHIEPDPNGATGPVSTAFNAIGSYFEENDSAEGVNIEFTVFGRTFHANMDADPQYLAWKSEHSKL